MRTAPCSAPEHPPSPRLVALTRDPRQPAAVHGQAGAGRERQRSMASHHPAARIGVGTAGVSTPLTVVGLVRLCCRCRAGRGRRQPATTGTANYSPCAGRR